MKYGKITSLILGAIIMALFATCKKDKIPLPEPEPQPTKWEIIAGHYKVYDTMGVFLYEMDLVHVPAVDNDYVDSLRFENFDGEFTFTTKQITPTNYPMSIRIGGHDTLYDHQENRWKLSAGIYEYYNNYFNDTIPLRFQKTNINYYLEDLVPYYACDCKQIAVKQ